MNPDPINEIKIAKYNIRIVHPSNIANPLITSDERQLEYCAEREGIGVIMELTDVNGKVTEMEFVIDNAK